MNSGWSRNLPDFLRKKLAGRQTLQKTLGHTGWMMGDQIVRTGMGFLVGVLIARYLGPKLYGQFSYAIAFAMIFSPFAMLGLDEIVIRRLIQEPSERNDLLGTSFVLMTAGGVLVFAISMAVIVLTLPTDTLMHWLVGIMVGGAVFQAMIAVEFWFESQLQWKYTVYAKTTVFLLLSVAKIGLILAKAPLVAFAWAAFAETVLGSLGLAIVYRWRGYHFKPWRFKWETTTKLLSDSWPIVFTTLATMIYLRIDQIMLGNLAGNEELGVYSVAVRLSEAFYFIPVTICSAVFPAVVEAGTISEKLFFAHLQKLYNLMALIAYAVAIPVTIFSREIVRLLFNTDFVDAGPLLAILIWAGLFTNLGAARNVFILSKNWTRINLASTLLGCVVNIYMNSLLIPKYGPMGAVMATCVSYWLAVHGTCFLFKSLRPTGWMLTRAMFFPKVW